MPRISRNSVVFSVGEATFQATFSHQHANRVRTYEQLDKTPSKNPDEPPHYKVAYFEEKEVPITLPSRTGKGSMKLRHVTTCRLFEGSTEVGVGIARCSMKDEYNWRRGIKDSLKAAIHAAGFGKQEGLFLAAYFTELSHRA